MTSKEIGQLATYNGECARGIEHTAEWQSQMRELQRAFDQEQVQSPDILLMQCFDRAYDMTRPY